MAASSRTVRPKAHFSVRNGTAIIAVPLTFSWGFLRKSEPVSEDLRCPERQTFPSAPRNQSRPIKSSTTKMIRISPPGP